MATRNGTALVIAESKVMATTFCSGTGLASVCLWRRTLVSAGWVGSATPTQLLRGFPVESD